MKAVRIALLLVLAAGPVAAQAAAGSVLFALGRVEIQRNGQTLAAARGTPVEVGDTIATGPTGMAQVRLKDGALLSLRYGSTMKVEEFRMPDPAPATAPAAPAGASIAAPAASGGNGRSVLRLLRGAFRTVTGLIGKGANDAYRVVTPVATIGIRGTDYSAAYCSGDCGSTPDGLYVGVSSGEIELNNDGGQLVLGNDQYGSVKNQSTAPEQEVAPPEVLETPIAPGDGEDSGDDDGAGAETPSGESPPDAGAGAESEGAKSSSVVAEQPEGEYELLPGRPGSFAFAKDGGTGGGDDGVYTDASGGLIGFLGDTPVSIGTASNQNRGSDAATGLQWGRWSGGEASFGGTPFDLSQGSLHWIYAETAGTPALRTTGSASYTWIGGTNPTDSAGHTGQLVDATLSADFNNQTVSSTLNIIGINDTVLGDTVWIASSTSGSIASGTPVFSGVYAVQVNDAVGATLDPGATGSFSGFFTSNAAAAGLTFSLSSSVTGTSVSGAAAFEESAP